MEFLKAQIARLQTQFEQLSASQKMLSVSLVAIMVMTLLWWGRYAGQAEMEALSDRDFTPEEVARLTGEMHARGIPVTTAGTRVLVAADRKTEALGALIYADILPQETSSPLLLEIMQKATNAFSSTAQTEIAYNAAHEAELALMFRGFKGVQNAKVAIAVPQRQGFGESTPTAASVIITMKAGQKLEGRLPTAVCALMTGAVAGLKRSNVHVVVDGKPCPVPKDDEADNEMSGDRLHTMAELELHYKEKIRDHFKFLSENVSAEVSIKLTDATIDTHEVKYDAKASFTKDIESTSETTASGSKTSGTSEPGVTPNTGANERMAVGPSGGEGTSTSTDKNTLKSQAFPSSVDSRTHNPSGGHTVTGASVMFPRSMFVKSFMAENQVEKAPNATVLEAYIRSVCDRYKLQVKGCCDMIADANITVDSYPDMVAPTSDAPSQAVGGVSLMLSGHIKEIALAALAVASLFMFSMMVRKGGGPVLAGVGPKGLHSPDVGPGSTVDAMLAKAGGKSPVDVTTVVGEGGQMLDGVEMDEEAVRAQQVVEQVSSLVKENPDAAANLIKRWMNKT